MPFPEVFGMETLKDRGVFDDCWHGFFCFLAEEKDGETCSGHHLCSPFEVWILLVCYWRTRAKFGVFSQVFFIDDAVINFPEPLL